MDWSALPLTRRKPLRAFTKLALAAAADLDPAAGLAGLADAARTNDGTPTSEQLALAAHAAHASLGLTPYPVQFLGAAALLQGWVAEMATGEGKTLTAAFAAATSALCGTKVHLMTANEYLATRDAAWMSPLYELLGLRCAAVVGEMSNEDRKAAYDCDVVYGTASQFGFDYLNDHLVNEAGLLCQRGWPFALVDEADALLLDDARTPLVVASSARPAPDVARFAAVAARIDPTLVEIEEDKQLATLTDDGRRFVEEQLQIEALHEHPVLSARMFSAVLARFVYQRDRDYVVEDHAVVLVDPSTGRLQHDRRFRGGLHEALEAKENVPVRPQTRHVAQITIPSFLARYTKVAAMTGTAYSSRKEFAELYGLEVLKIPTHRPRIRVDHPDRVYLTEAEKFAALVEEVTSRTARHQPVLVGTSSIAESERVAGVLAAASIPHVVLNAKNHAAEARLIAQAGRPGAVTVATNMAGRGVDILLGGDPSSLVEQDPDAAARCAQDRLTVLGAGGLCVLATSRHTSRRVDDQLRGRAGRQGEPGETVFMVSLQDELVRSFAQGAATAMLSRVAEKQGAVSLSMLTRILDTAQERLEQAYVTQRADQARYAAVHNAQREHFYALRERILSSPWSAGITELATLAYTAAFADPAWLDADTRLDRPDAPVADDAGDDLEEDLEEDLDPFAEFDPVSEDPAAFFYLGIAGGTMSDASRERVLTGAAETRPARFAQLFCEFQARIRSEIPDALLDQAMRFVALRTLDIRWSDHLADLEILEEGIGLRALGQKDPRAEFVRDATVLFEGFLAESAIETLRQILTMQVTLTEPDEAVDETTTETAAKTSVTVAGDASPH